MVEGCVCARDPYCCAVEWDAACVGSVGLGCGSCAGASCGNDAIDGYEVCDGTDLGGEMCTSLGFTGGALACLSDCSGYDTSGCTGTGPVCGNNVAEGTEECDGADLRGASCADLAWYVDGVLACRPGCDGYDASACRTAAGGECCETIPGGGCDDYTVETCVCSVDRFCCTIEWDQNCVTQVDTLGCGRCLGMCGDNYADIGERCDGFNLRGMTCETLGYTGGTLSCANDCLGFVTTACTGTGPVCGNRILEGLEPCDDTNLDGKTCSSLHFAGGTLACDPTCRRFNTSGCTREVPTSCGDGIINGFDRCDGSAWRSASFADCASYNLGSGTMVCTSLCEPDYSLCELTDVCAAYGVYDDGTCDACDWIGGTVDDPDCRLECAANGICGPACLYYGVIDPDCATCGNGVQEDYEECDGGDLTIDECDPFFGYTGGTMGCTATCRADFSGCTL
ncbi:MAG: hypothetical protein HYZ27_08605 [Deltaproteobacteria bacterium]|nr:hypothetical protein [Deltaproteobacteria bacterium]